MAESLIRPVMPGGDGADLEDGSDGSTAKGDEEMPGEVIPPDEENGDGPSRIDPELVEALEEDRAGWPEPSADDAKEALDFLESHGEDVLKLVEISRGLPRRLDADVADRCAALNDELDGEFEFAALLAAASSIPESVLWDVATSQIMALSDGLESCRAGDEQQCRTLLQVAAGLSDSFDVRMSQLKARR